MVHSLTVGLLTLSSTLLPGPAGSEKSADKPTAVWHWAGSVQCAEVWNWTRFKLLLSSCFPPFSPQNYCITFLRVLTPWKALKERLSVRVRHYLHLYVSSRWDWDDVQKTPSSLKPQIPTFPPTTSKSADINTFISRCACITILHASSFIFRGLGLSVSLLQWSPLQLQTKTHQKMNQFVFCILFSPLNLFLSSFALRAQENGLGLKISYKNDFIYL